MKRVALIFVSAIVVSCSDSEYINSAVDDGNTVQETPLGPPAMVVQVATSQQCPAGGNMYTFFNDADLNGNFGESENLIQRQVVCNGVSGQNGQDGQAGADGLSMVFETVVASTSQCANGGNVLFIALDADRNSQFNIEDQSIQSLIICNGNNGANGSDGQDGQDGADGQDGQDGADGQDASIRRFTPVDVVMACGNASPYKEVLLILHSGDVLTSFSNNAQGDMTRLSFLPDGTYMNTDSSGCIFSISTSLDGTERSISWNNVIHKTWSINP
jgi:hypothetical protein